MGAWLMKHLGKKGVREPLGELLQAKSCLQKATGWWLWAQATFSTTWVTWR